MNSNDIEGCTRFIWILFIILQQCVAVIIAYAIAITFDGYLDELWLWHKVLTPIGVILIMGEGILAFSSYNHVTSGIRKITLNQLHGYIMGVGLVVMTVGISFAIATNDHHFTSPHGIIGLIAWILCVISAVGGIFTLYSTSLRDIIRPIYLRFCHTLLGLTAFLASIAAAASGFYKLIDSKPTGVPIIMALVALVGVSLFLTSARTVLKNTKLAFTS